jgi:hypothetical protein
MADSIPWFKAIQSVGRGFRPGMEVKVVSAGKDVGKTLINIDIESGEFKPWRETFLTHYVEYWDSDTGVKRWKKFNRTPKIVDLYTASNVIRRNEDGSYEYIKNRETGIVGIAPSPDDMAWIILEAG